MLAGPSLAECTPVLIDLGSCDALTVVVASRQEAMLAQERAAEHSR
jgi:hypothetical protein